MLTDPRTVCGCDAETVPVEGLGAHGAGSSVILLDDAEPPVWAEVCRACRVVELKLMDSESDVLLARLPEGETCGCGSLRRRAWLGFEGAGPLVDAGGEAQPVQLCLTCRRVSLIAARDGRVSAAHGGWVHLQQHPVECRSAQLFVGPGPLAVEIPGLAQVVDWLSETSRGALLAAVDEHPWRDDLRRRVQHHGWRYDYRRRTVDPADHLGPLPDWSAPLAARLVDEGFFRTPPDQLIVNEYLPGQGISAHVDAAAFGHRVASLSLGSSAQMVLSHRTYRKELTLEPGSLIVLRGPARHLWRHAIPARKSDPAATGGRVRRTRRVSLTFRTVGQAV